MYKMLQALNHLCDPVLDLVQYVPGFLLLGSSAPDPELQMFLTRAE